MTFYKATIFYVFSLVIIKGVFGVDVDEVKSVSVMEGDSVTLHTDITQIQTDDHIMWMFGHQETHIAEINKGGKLKFLNDGNGTFKGKLQLNNKTGSLTIANISITQSGLYKLTITNSRRGNSYKKFYVIVYEPWSITQIVGVTTVVCQLMIIVCVMCCNIKKFINGNHSEKAGSDHTVASSALIPEYAAETFV